MNNIKKIFGRVVEREPKFKKMPFKIVKVNVNIDTKLQSILLNHYLSTPYKK
jgi:hypothetical protein